MKRLLLIFLLAPLPAKADTIPAYVLDKEYEMCMQSGGVSNGMEAQKQQYCLCVRNRLAAWNANAYAQLAQEEQNGNRTPPMLEELAKECIAQTMR